MDDRELLSWDLVELHIKLTDAVTEDHGRVGRKKVRELVCDEYERTRTLADVFDDDLLSRALFCVELGCLLILAGAELTSRHKFREEVRLIEEGEDE